MRLTQRILPIGISLLQETPLARPICEQRNRRLNHVTPFTNKGMTGDTRTEIKPVKVRNLTL